MTPMVDSFTCASRPVARKAGFSVVDSAGKSMRWDSGHSIPSARPMPENERWSSPCTTKKERAAGTFKPEVYSPFVNSSESPVVRQSFAL